MKTRIGVLFMLSILFFSCQKEEEVTIQLPYFIYETSFETNGRFDTDGWTGKGFSASEDTPFPEDAFSLSLETEGFAPSGELERSITGLSGERSLELQFYAKTIFEVGEVQVIRRTPNNFKQVLLTEQISEEDWTYKSYIFEADLDEGDELILQFTTQGGTLDMGIMRLDRVKLYVLNP